ncbi:MAG: hypothetical protein ACI4RT_01755 [Candidatus Spyradenecus sp.]
MTYTQYNARDMLDYGSYSIYRRNTAHPSCNILLDTLICGWYNRGNFMNIEAPHAVDGLAEKFRRLAIREAEKAGWHKTAEYIRKNDGRKALDAYIREENARRKAARTRAL